MSEIKQVNTGKAELLIVKVPEGAYRFYVDLGIEDWFVSYTWDNQRYNWAIKVPAGNYTPLGLSDQLTELQYAEVLGATEYIDDLGYFLPVYGYWGFKHYKTAKEAFASLMQANQCYTENPLQLEWDEACTYGHGGCNYDEYFAEQENVGSWLILKRI